MSWLHWTSTGAGRSLVQRLTGLAGWLLLSAATGPAQAGSGILECMPPRTVDVTVRIGRDVAPVTLKLAGGISPALRLFDAQTGAMRWSAAAAAPASQVFPGMRAGFAGSLAVVDLDGDGLHDRIYAGDLAGRLWRFDIHHGERADALFTGGIFASLGGEPAVRAFLAPPDLSFTAAAGHPSAINIAIGTASLWQGQERNRFYVLRDRAPFEVWSAEDYLRWRPLTEADLVWANDPSRAAGASPDPQGGFYVSLEHGSVVLPSITVSGRTFMAVADDFARSGSTCGVAVTVSSLSLENGRPVAVSGGVNDGGGTMRLPERIALSAAFHIEAAAGVAVATCRLGDVEIPGCTVSTRPTPLWWRREDAD